MIQKRISRNQKQGSHYIQHYTLNLNRRLLKRTNNLYSDRIGLLWDGRIRTSESRDQNPLPYRLATPHLYLYLTLINTNIGLVYSSIPTQIYMEQVRLLLGFDTCSCRIQLNLLIITQNSIKILYESMTPSILVWELKDF